MIAISVIYAISLIKVETQASEIERQWIVQLLSFAMGFWFLTIMFEYLQDRCNVDVLSFGYYFSVFLVMMGAIAGLTYFSYISLEELDESIKGHDSSALEMMVHEGFLVLRFLCVGFNVMLCFTLVAFIIFVAYEKCFDRDD